ALSWFSGTKGSPGLARLRKALVRQPRCRLRGCRTSALRSRANPGRSEEHTSELQSLTNLVCRLLLEKKKRNTTHIEGADTRSDGVEAVKHDHAALHSRQNKTQPHVA